MKSKKLLLSLSMFLLSSGLLFNTASEVKDKTNNDGGVFICEDTGEEGPIFYPAEYSTEITDEPSYSTQNGYTFSTLGFENAHKFYRGDSVKVAVIDSGLNYTHEDFEDSNGNQIIQGTSRTIDNTSGSWLYYQFNSGYQSKIVDSLGHGTNVASVIASQINALGCAGIAPNVELYVYKVTNTDNGYEWTAINSALTYCISEKIDVINMSFQAYEHAVTYNGSTMPASTGCSSVMTSYINSCYNAGITLVAAAGNYNTSEPSYPASNNHVISVGSLDESSTYTKAGYSNTYGIDLVAPGTVYVADKGTNSSYKKTSGTSFSAPIVTAAIALYKQQNPNATPSQIESALYASCDTVSGSPSWAGNGRLNIDKFLGTQSIGPTDIVVNNPEVVNDELELEVGETLDLDWTVNGVGTFDESVTFSTDSETEDVVSVSPSGKITAIAEGEDLVGITSNEDDSVSAWISVTVTASSTPSGPDPATDSTQYSLINSTDDLEAGYSYIITNGTSGTVKTMANTTNTNNRPTRDITFSSGKITRGSATLSVTLEASGNYWKIKTENYTSTNNYFTQGNQTGSNLLQISSSGDNWSISFNGDAAVITSQLKTSRNIIRCNNSGTPISCYTSGQNPVYLLKQVTQSDKTLSSIAVETAPTKTTYTAGEYFDPTGLVIRRNFSDSTQDTYTYLGHTSEFTFSPSTSTALTTSNVSVSITYGGKSCSQVITVNAAQKTLSSIAVETAPTKTQYEVGENFDPTDLVIRRNYSDSTHDTYTYLNHSGDFSFTPSLSTALTTSDVSVTITYGGKSTTQAITVSSSGGETTENSVTFDLSSTGYKGTDLPSGVTEGPIMLKATTNGSSAWRGNSEDLRVYQGAVLTISIIGNAEALTEIIVSPGGSYNPSGNYTFKAQPSGNTITYDSTGMTMPSGTTSFTITRSTSGRCDLSGITVSYSVDSSPATSITATVRNNKTFYVGDSITKSDITVTTNKGDDVTSEIIFENYLFIYSDAASGGALTNKEFSITYEELSTTLTAQVQRKSFTAATQSTSSYTGSNFSSLSSSYSSGQSITISGTSFAVDGYYYSNKTALSLSNGKTSTPGSIKNTTAYSKPISSVSVTGASPDIQLSTNGSLWVDLSSATPETTNYYYFKLFYKTNQSDYVNITGITVTHKGIETERTLSDYIMYEDTNNQCTTKFIVAKGYFENMTKEGRVTFMTSNDYVISTARERLLAWAAHEGKTISASGDDYIISKNPVIYVLEMVTGNTGTVIAAIAAIIGLSAIGGYFFIRRRKEY